MIIKNEHTEEVDPNFKKPSFFIKENIFGKTRQIFSKTMNFREKIKEIISRLT